MAGWLVQLFSAPVAVALDSLTFAASAGLLATIRHREPPPARRVVRGGAREIFAETWEGLRFTLHDRLLRRLLACGVALAVSAGIFSVVFLLFVHEELGFPAGGLGMVFAVGAVSSFVGALAAERATRRFGPARTMVVGLLLYAASTALIPLIPTFGLLGWLLMIGHQLGDGGEVAYAVNHVSLIQATVPGERLGRVTGAFEFAGVGAILVGTALGGLLGEVLGSRGTLLTATGFATLAALSLLRLPGPRLDGRGSPSTC